MTHDNVSRRVLRADRHSALEDALATEVRRAREADPLRPIDLLVGSNLLGIHLRRALARRLGALAAVRTPTFLDLARGRAERELASADLRPLPPLGDELIIGRVVAALPAGGYFEPVRETPGFHAALLASIRDLKDAGWAPTELRGRLGSARPEPDVRRKLEAFAGIFEAYERERAARRLYDRSDLLARAAAAGSGTGSASGVTPGRPGRGLFLVYGFYDLIELQWRLLEAHARETETIVFLPAGEGPAFTFAEPLLRRLEGAGFAVEDAPGSVRPPAATAAPEGATAVPRSGATRFDRAPGPSGAPRAPVQIGLPFDAEARDLDTTPAASPTCDATPPHDASAPREVTFLSAPSEEREAEEIAGSLLDWARSGLRFHEMAVLARRREPHLTTLARALGRAGIPFVAAQGEPVAESSEAAALTALLAIPLDDWRRSDVIAFLSLADLPPTLRTLPDGTMAAAPSEWDLLTAEGGVVGGREEWKRAFTREIGRARARTARLEEEVAARPAVPGDEDDDALEAKLADARRAIDLWRRLEETILRIDRALAPWERARTWSEASSALRDALRALIAPSSDREALESMLEGLSALDDAGPYPGREGHARMVRRALDARRVKRGRYQRNGVLLSDVVSARGLSFRAVAVAGMVERGFPVQGREDPILLDDERAALGAGAKGLAPLPLKGDRLSEERLLFRIASDAATERLLYARARAMGVEERESLPSPFYRDALGDGAGRATDTVARERHVDLLPPVHVESTTALDAHAWSLGEAWRLGTAGRGAGAALVVEGGPPGATSDLREVYPFLDRALRAERARWRSRRFGAHDGLLGAKAAAQAAARLLADPLSASRIERYAECPLRALFGSVMGLRPVPDPAEVTSIEPLDRGLLYHAILAEFFGVLAKEQGGAVRLSARDLPALHARLVETADRHFARLAEDSPVGYPLLWEVEKTRMRDNLLQCLEEAIEDSARTGYLPAAFEWTFGRGAGSATAVAMDLPRAGRVSFQGRIDRIDVHEDGRRARVIDYKTRDGEWVGGETRLADGRSIQLPIYMEAAAQFRSSPEGGPLRVDAGRYVFMVGDEAKGIDRESVPERRAALQRALEVLVGSIRSGDFTADPRPGGACGICDFTEPCGEGRERLFARKRADAVVADRLALRERAAAPRTGVDGPGDASGHGADAEADEEGPA